MPIIERHLKREDGTIVILSIKGTYDCHTGDLASSVFARVKKSGQAEWRYFYPPRKGDAVMRNMSVAEYLKEGWGAVVKPGEVIKLTSDFIDLLNQPADGRLFYRT